VTGVQLPAEDTFPDGTVIRSRIVAAGEALVIAYVKNDGEWSSTDRNHRWPTYAEIVGDADVAPISHIWVLLGEGPG
jgi:hypothetical protein